MWFWWGIISAIFASVSTIYIKHSLKRISPVLITWAIIVFPIPVLIALCLPNPINSLNLLFWVGVCSSALFFTFAKLWSTQAVQVGLLSKLMPLSCFGTFFLYIWGLIFLGEQITIINFLGMTCIISGAYFLNIESVHEGFWQPITLLFKNKNTMLYLLAMLIGSFVSIFDKTALNNVSPSNPNFTYLMENIVTVIPFTLYLMKKESQIFSKIKTHFWTLLAVGLIYAFSVITLFYAFMSGPVVLSVVLRQTQIATVMLLSFFIFADKPPKHTWLATLIMLAGVVLVKVG
ncbi:MAG: Integral membrane protein DUF6 [Candidatus Gottesmanbacteria bacterium GW2011_GWA1_34_13]|uniref:Integral membrane protein DUF6 n=1 Tax=Candidatus Gottesmanbacteria bacterium GW2011_GWA1_34_13 TaxID=1618434 RepID=A0A0G0DSP1_9BACT|nr:MAG: Integral membrane protein DUF6 [Candidatus Gottesmanbacteria bacterium GW2011_GWA1_34_13]